MRELSPRNIGLLKHIFHAFHLRHKQQGFTHLQTHGPMHQIEVQVVHFKITESLLTALSHQGLLMESGPQLWDERETVQIFRKLLIKHCLHTGN